MLRILGKCIVPLLLWVIFLWFPQKIFAGTITGITYGPSGSTVGTYVGASLANFTIFTPATALASLSTIKLTFPSGTTLTTGNIATSDFTIQQGTSGACVTAGTATAPSSIAADATNRTITLTIASGSLSKTVLSVDCGLGEVTIKTTASFGANEIQHPTTTTTTATFQIDTTIISVGTDTGSISNVSFVADSANKLAFSTQPSTSGTAGTNFTTQPAVTVQDQYGNTITGSSASITLAAVLSSDGTTTGGGTLNATTNPLSASSGVATFAGINYTKAETVKLKATSTGLTQALSSAITVSAGSATKLGVSVQPSSTAIAGTTFDTQPVFLIQDAFGNTVTGDSSTTVTISAVLASDSSTAGTGTLNATTNPVTASSGVATFAGVNYTVAETINIKATATGLTQKLSDAIAVSAMTISSVSVSTTSTTATITWTTNTAASSKVDYGLTSSYGSTTSETDTSPRVTNHSVQLSSLTSCVTYHFRVRSKAAGGNETVDSDNSFTTSGCSGSASVSSEQDTTITTSGGTVQLLASDSTGATLTVPSGYYGSSLEFQIKQVNVSSTLNGTGPVPSGSVISNYMYNIQALTDISTTVSSFNKTITVTFGYAKSDVTSFNEYSLKIYKYDTSWQQLSNCTLNRDTRTVSCTTSSFSTFALLGEPNPNPLSVANSPSPTGCDHLSPGKTPPQLYAAIPETSDKIRLYFTSGDGPLDQYAIQYGLRSGTYIYGAKNIAGNGMRTYLVESLLPNTTYFFQVRADNGCAAGNWSNEISATTNYPIYVPPKNTLEIRSSKLEPVTCISFYTVKEGDTLWSIGAKLLKDGSRYNEIILSNKDSLSSLDKNPLIYPGDTLRIPCDEEKTKQVGSTKPKERTYDLSIKIVDIKNNPIKGAKVVLHSTPQESYTNTEGIARFTKVEKGGHSIVISYNGYWGDQYIGLFGDQNKLSLNIQVQPNNTSIFITSAGFCLLLFSYLRWKKVRRLH